MFLQGPSRALGAQIWAQGVTFLVFAANLAPRGRFLDFSGLGERTLTFLVNTFLVSKVGVFLKWLGGVSPHMPIHPQF